MTDCVKVAVRGRPLSNRELAEGATECLQYFVDKNQLAVNGSFFTFDMIFDSICSQANIYEICAAPLVEKLFTGYNCTLIAYGQTGSGKTYTIGTEETEESMKSEGRGIIPRIIDAIFCQVNNSAATSYSVSVSMLEIYEEKVFDLLSSKKEVLQVREKNGTTFVQGLTCELVTDLKSAMRQLEKGGKMRSKGETAMNLKSSRSHAVFTVYLNKISTESSEETFNAKLYLVDLAGSERLKKTLAEGQRLREGIKINSGLLALGNVISALVEQGPNSGHIPYRDSKITRLLQDSLGGNCCTIIIACISPADTSAEETLSTLRYANRAKSIRNKPVINIDPNLKILQELRSQLVAAQHELAVYKMREHDAQAGITDKYGFQSWDRLNELQAKYDSLLNENRCVRLHLVETITENGQIIRQLSKLEDERERLNKVIANVRRILHAHYDQLNATDDMKQIMHILQILHCKQNQAEESALLAKSEEEDNGGGEEILFSKKYAEKQRKLASLIDEIKSKEKIVELTMATEEQIQKMRMQHAIEVDELNARLVTLQQEKDELLMKLGRSNSENKLTFIEHKFLILIYKPCNLIVLYLLRISEQLRRRAQELEKEIALSQKRLAEVAKLESEKAKLQEKLSKLTAELSLRVKMANQIKNEETKFRRWKSNIEREIIQMRNQERKREVLMVREAALSKQQLTVYRQKYKEANACNRRLQQQLCAAMKRKVEKKSTKEIDAFLDQELELAFSAAEAEMHCKVLIEQRKNLSLRQRNLVMQLEQLSEEPPNKKDIDNDYNELANSDEIHQLHDQIDNLQHEIDLRNTELRDMQEKCAKASDDLYEEKRWDNISSLLCAKIALKRMFANVIDERREMLEKERLLEQLKREKEEAEVRFNETKLEYEKMLEEERRKGDEMKLALAHAEYVNAQKLFSSSLIEAEDYSSTNNDNFSSKSQDENFSCKEMSDDNYEDINDVTYYPTPLLRKRRRHLRIVKAPISESFHRYRSQEPIKQWIPTINVSAKEAVNHNSTFTVERHADFDNSSKLVIPVITKTESPIPRLQRVTKSLFERF